MTYAPERLLEARRYLMPATGITDLRLIGITPDPSHNGGYHCGWDQRRIVNGQLDDYSWEESSRDWNRKTNAARAIDIGMFGRLRELSIWLVEQCKADAPDTRDIREIIYSPDGQRVLRWDRLGKRSTGDNSHLTHTHISYFADAEHNDKVGPFRRFFEGDEMIDQTMFEAMAWRRDAETADVPFIRGGPYEGERNEPHFARKAMEAKLDELSAKVDALTVPAPAPVDPAALAAALTQPSVLAAIAAAVADENHRRTAQ